MHDVCCDLCLREACLGAAECASKVKRVQSKECNDPHELATKRVPEVILQQLQVCCLALFEAEASDGHACGEVTGCSIALNGLLVVTVHRNRHDIIIIVATVLVCALSNVTVLLGGQCVACMACLT